ncbi:MAG: alpha/beta fold hydrolase [Kofleriaceae bacterium]|nr:alpha/beta fold hydrolase [Kofleriaceae bacterium]
MARRAGPRRRRGGVAAARRATDGATWTAVAGGPWLLRVAGGAAAMASPVEPSPRLRAMLPALWAHDGAAALRALAVPVLVACGDVDPLVPARCARAVADAVAGARLAMIAGAGHVPLVERPAALAAEVAALRAVVAAR